MPRDRRYGEKLATPDITIADLIGEVDPIKVAEGRYLSDELTIHYGLIPRTNRGIFCINELPDLAERIQVGLLNIMEERDVQIRGYKMRLPLDVFVVASANPEDYTNRGRIITPLKDRFGSQIRTHYPRTIEHEIDIMEQERAPFDAEGIDGRPCPQYMKEIVAEITHLARRSPRHQPALRRQRARLDRQLREHAEQRPAPRDPARRDARSCRASATCARSSPRRRARSSWRPSATSQEEKVIEKLVRQAINRVFREYFEVSEFEQLVAGFEKGLNVDVSDMQPSMEYVNQLARVGGLKRGGAEAGRPRQPGDGRLGGRVHPRRAAPQQAPQQRRGRRADALPSLRVAQRRLGRPSLCYGERLP